MRNLLLLAGLLMATPCCAQEALTLDRCRADARLWSNTDLQVAYDKAELEFTEKGTKNQTEFALIPFKLLLARGYEMSQCIQIESGGISSEQFRLYEKAGAFIQRAVNQRYWGFIRRHDLRDQFIKEDEAGER